MLGKGFWGFFPLSVGGFTTFFPDLRKPSLDTLLGKGLKLRGPHSLGTLIEWKLLRDIMYRCVNHHIPYALIAQ